MKTLIFIIFMTPLLLSFSHDTEIMRQQLQQQEEENRKAYIHERQEKARKNKEHMRRAQEKTQKQEAPLDRPSSSD